MIAQNPDGFQLDADGYAVPQADLLADFLAEHGDDPNEGPPEDWPDEYDSIRVAIGPAFTREESLFDEEPAPDLSQPPDEWPLTGPEDLEELRRVESIDPFDPLPPDEVDEIPF